MALDEAPGRPMTMLAITEVLPPGHDEAWPLKNSLSLRAGPGSVPHARHYVSGTLFNWNFSGQLLSDAEVVTSELVTNAIQACQADRTTRLCRVRPITLFVRSNFASAVIEIADLLHEPPQPIEQAQVDTEGGRGLLLVELFSASWGWYTTDAGKSVWASFVRYEPTD
jgi:Histidine kinase-like ATPase domain